MTHDFCPGHNLVDLIQRPSLEEDDLGRGFGAGIQCAAARRTEHSLDGLSGERGRMNTMLSYNVRGERKNLHVTKGEPKV
jgi:hypothetical protein